MLIALALMAAGQGAVPAPFDWLAGSWCSGPVNGIQSCETWTQIGKGVLRGEGITQGERVTHREAMRIIVGESEAVFHAEPQGQTPTDFHAVRFDPEARAATFENKTHDYPQRVRYWREGELLMAETSLADGGKPQRWTYRRVR